MRSTQGQWLGLAKDPVLQGIVLYLIQGYGQCSDDRKEEFGTAQLAEAVSLSWMYGLQLWGCVKKTIIKIFTGFSEQAIT